MSDHVYGLPPSDGGNEESTPVSTYVMIGGLVVAALGFVVAGVGFGVGWWGPKAREVELAASAEPDETQAATETGDPELAILPGAEPMPIPEDRPGPVAVEPDEILLPGAEPVPEIAPSSARGAKPSSTGGGSGAPASDGDSKAGGEDGKRPPRVRVAFMRGHYEQVEVKLGGKVFTLDKDRTIRLPPGGYRIELRKSPDAPWKPAGLLEIQLGKRYRVTLYDPPLAKLDVVE